jgi:hypothetical protein
VEAAEKSELRAALYPVDFGIVWIGVGTKENNGSGIFGGWRFSHDFTSADYADFTDSKKTISHEKAQKAQTECAV